MQKTQGDSIFPAPPGNKPAESSKRRNSDWDIRNAPKNYVSLVLTHGITALFSFAGVWLITRHLGPEGYGAIVAVVSVSQLVQIFLNWSSTAMARFGIEEFIETGRITRSFWTRTLILLPNLMGVMLLSGYWLELVVAAFKIPESVAWLVGVHLVATALWLHIQYAMQGTKMLRLQGIMLASERGLTFLFLLASLGWAGLSAQLALWAYIVPAVILTFVGALVLRPYVVLSGVFDAAHFRKMLVYSLPLIPYALVGYLSTSQLDAFFITRYLSTSDLGIYAVAAQINGIVLQLPILANSILMSLFVSFQASRKEVATQRFFRHVLPTVALGWGLFCSVLSLIGGWILPLIFGQEFSESKVPLWILLAASAVTAPSMFGYAALSHALSATYISAIAATSAAVVNVLFNILLIPKLGLIGCAVSSLLSATALNLMVVILTQRRASHISISWAFFSGVPGYLGVVTLLLLDSVTAAFLVVFLLACVLGTIFWKSLQETVGLIRVRYLQAKL